MVATTPVYAFPYQGLTDAPNGPTLGANLAAAVETELVRVDAAAAAVTARVTTLEGDVYEARQTLGGAVASVTFSGIPTALRALQLKWTARGSDAATFVHFRAQVNSDAGANYNAESSQGLGGAVSAFSQLAAAYAFCGHMTAAGTAAGIFASGVVDFVGWDSPHATFLGFTFASQAMTGGGLINNGGGTYSVAGPYTALKLLPAAGNFVTGSDFHLLGWRS